MQADRVGSPATYDGVYNSGALCEQSFFQHFPFGEESEVKKKELHRERMRKWREKKRREREALLAMGINSQEIKSEIEREREKSRIRSKRWREKRKQGLAATLSPEHLETLQGTELAEQLEPKPMETWRRPSTDTALQNGSLDQLPGKIQREAQPGMELSHNHQAPWHASGPNIRAGDSTLIAASGLRTAQDQLHRARKREQQRVYMRQWRQRKRLLTDNAGSASDDSCTDAAGDKKEQRRIYMRLYRQRKKLERDFSGASFPYLSGPPSMVSSLNPLIGPGNDCSLDSGSTFSNHGSPCDIATPLLMHSEQDAELSMAVRPKQRKPRKCCLGGTRKSRYQSFSQYQAKVLIGRSKMMIWQLGVGRKWQEVLNKMCKTKVKDAVKEAGHEPSDQEIEASIIGKLHVHSKALGNSSGLEQGTVVNDYEKSILNFDDKYFQGNINDKLPQEKGFVHPSASNEKDIVKFVRPNKGISSNMNITGRKNLFRSVSKCLRQRMVMGKFCITKAKERIRKAANRQHMYWLREAKINDFGIECNFSSPESNKTEFAEGEGNNGATVPSTRVIPVVEEYPDQATATSQLPSLNNSSSHQRQNHIAQNVEKLPETATSAPVSCSKDSISCPDDGLLLQSSLSGTDLKNGLKNAKVDPHIYSLMQAFLGSDELDNEGVQQSVECDTMAIYNPNVLPPEQQDSSQNISITQAPEPKNTTQPVQNTSGDKGEPKASSLKPIKAKSPDMPKLKPEMPVTTPKTGEKNQQQDAMDLTCRTKLGNQIGQTDLKSELLSGLDMGGMSMAGLSGIASTPYMASLTAYYQQLMALQHQSLQLQQHQLQQQQNEQLQQLAEQQLEKEKKQQEKEEQQKKEKQRLEKERQLKEKELLQKKEKQQQLTQQEDIKRKMEKEQQEQGSNVKTEDTPVNFKASSAKLTSQAPQEKLAQGVSSSNSKTSDPGPNSAASSPVLPGVVPPGMMMLPNPGMFGLTYNPMLPGYPFGFTSPLMASNLTLPSEALSSEERRKEAARIRMRQWRQKQKMAKDAKGESDKEQEKRRANAERVKRWRERKKLEQQLKHLQGEENSGSNAVPIPTAAVMSRAAPQKPAEPLVAPTFPELEGRSRSKMSEEERRKVSTERVRRWRERKRMERQLQMMQSVPSGGADDTKSDNRGSDHQGVAPALPTVGSMWPPWMTR